MGTPLCTQDASSGDKGVCNSCYLAIAFGRRRVARRHNKPLPNSPLDCILERKQQMDSAGEVRAGRNIAEAPP